MKIDFEPTETKARLETQLAELERLNNEYKLRGAALSNELKTRRAELTNDVDELVKKLESGKKIFMTADEQSQEYNECVGCAYQRAVFVADGGEILYADIPNDMTVEIGDTWDDADLEPMSALPVGEREMLIRHLLDDEDTPRWFVSRMQFVEGERE